MKYDKEKGYILEKAIKNKSAMRGVLLNFIVLAILATFFIIHKMLRPESWPFSYTVFAACYAVMVFLMVAAVYYSYAVPYKILKTFREESKLLYLNGEELWRYFDTLLFARMSFYLEYGLCYEVAALVMMVMRRFESARIVIGEAVDKRQEVKLHAWVEFWFCGVWWVMDPAWESEALVMRWKYRADHGTPKVKRVISYQEFWDFAMVQDFYQHIADVETSFVFNKLVVFHNLTAPDYLMGFEKIGRGSLMDDGRTPDVLWLTAFGTDKPVDERMVTRMLEHPTTYGPKRRHYRIMRRFAKTISDACATAVDYEKRTGTTPRIIFVSERTFELKAHGETVFFKIN